MILRWFERDEPRRWMEQTWSFARSIVPLPSMIVIGRYPGAKKTAAFVGLVVVMSAVCGMSSGHFFP